VTPVHAVLLTPRSWKWSPSPSPPKPFIDFSPITPTCPVYLILHNCITLITFCEEQTSWSSALRNFHQSPVTSPLLGTNTFLTNYKNNQQDALYRLIYYSRSALHVSGDVFAHNQEHFTVFTVSGSIHTSCCRLVYTSRQQLGWTLPDTLNTVKCSWWWAKKSPETCRADLE